MFLRVCVRACVANYLAHARARSECECSCALAAGMLMPLGVRACDANALACACAPSECKCSCACAFGPLMLFLAFAIPRARLPSECYSLARARLEFYRSSVRVFARNASALSRARPEC